MTGIAEWEYTSLIGIPDTLVWTHGVYWDANSTALTSFNRRAKETGMLIDMLEKGISRRHPPSLGY